MGGGGERYNRYESLVVVLFCRRTFLTQCLKGRAVRREIIPVPWSTLGKSAGQRVCINVGDTKCCVSAEERSCLERVHTVRRSQR